MIGLATRPRVGLRLMRETCADVLGPLVPVLMINQFVYLETSGAAPLYARVTEITGKTAVLKTLRDYTHGKNAVWGVVARNREQNFALNLLMNPGINIVVGSASFLIFPLIIAPRLRSFRFRDRGPAALVEFDQLRGFSLKPAPRKLATSCLLSDGTIAETVARTPGIRRVALSTNGYRLAELAEDLAAAGVARIARSRNSSSWCRRPISRPRGSSTASTGCARATARGVAAS